MSGKMFAGFHLLAQHLRAETTLNVTVIYAFTFDC